MIGRSLGHKSSQSTAVYARSKIDPLRDPVEKATLQTIKKEDVSDPSKSPSKLLSQAMRSLGDSWSLEEAWVLFLRGMLKRFYS